MRLRVFCNSASTRVRGPSLNPRKMNPAAAAAPIPFPVDLPLVREYFPELGEGVVGQLVELARCILDWNTRINLISRKDAAHIEEHHILHALTLTKVLRPPPAVASEGSSMPSASFADLGTGGGFPGLVLAICYPQCRFTLVDSVGKKIAAVGEIARELGLKNVDARAQRAETISQKFDYVTGRAVTALPTFLGWARPLLKKDSLSRAEAEPSANGGVYYFKGTLWREELAGGAWQPSSLWPLDKWIPHPFFAEKFLLHFAR